jgi:hypothetical protein
MQSLNADQLGIPRRLQHNQFTSTQDMRITRSLPTNLGLVWLAPQILPKPCQPITRGRFDHLFFQGSFDLICRRRDPPSGIAIRAAILSVPNIFIS